MRHAWFLPADWVAESCPGCGRGDCTGRINVEFCPGWQAAAARRVFLPTIGAGYHMVGELVTAGDEIGDQGIKRQQQRQVADPRAAAAGEG